MNYIAKSKTNNNNNDNKDKDNKAIKSSFRCSTSMVTTCSFNHGTNKDWLAISCQSSKRLEIIDVIKCRSIYVMKGVYKLMRDSVWFGGNDPYILCASDDKHAHIFDPRQQNKEQKKTAKGLISSLSGHKSIVTSVDFGPSKPFQMVASVSCDNTLRLWNLQESGNKDIAIYNDHNDQIWRVRFNKHKSKLATVGDDGMLYLYSINKN